MSDALHTTDLDGGLKAAFDGYRLVLIDDRGMQRIGLTPQQWWNLRRYVVTLAPDFRDDNKAEAFNRRVKDGD